MRLVEFSFTNISYLDTLWEGYKQGAFQNYGTSLSKVDFLEALANNMKDYSIFWLLITDKEIVAFIFCNYKDGILEPHVETFPTVDKDLILQGYYFFFDMVHKDEDIKAAFLRCYSSSKQVFDHFVRKGLLNFMREYEDEYHYLLV